MLELIRTRAILLTLIVGFVVLATLPALAQTKADVENADAEREHAYQDLVDANDAVGTAIAALEAIGEELHELEATIGRLDAQITTYRDEVAGLEAIAREIVLEAYVNAGTELVTTVMSVDSLQDLVASQELIETAAAYDVEKLNRLSAVNREMERLLTDLGEGQARVEELLAAQQTETVRLEDARVHAEGVLEAAEHNYQDVVEEYRAELRRQAEAEAARRRAAAAAAQREAARSSTATAAAAQGEVARSSTAAAGLPPSSTTGVVCPVAGNTWFVDTWGAARSGGRTHKGTDMAAAYGTPLVAMYAGSVRLGWSSLGGRQVYLYADDGNFYYYAHLSDYPNGLSGGQRVDRGQVIGYVGSTGNATANVLHLGMGPSAGNYVNPYPTVRAVC
jgi:murein DD-endopeptidase MepM/ murein hydrolase activator NlpD